MGRFDGGGNEAQIGRIGCHRCPISHLGRAGGLHCALARADGASEADRLDNRWGKLRPEARGAPCGGSQGQVINKPPCFDAGSRRHRPDARGAPCGGRQGQVIKKSPCFDAGPEAAPFAAAILSNADFGRRVSSENVRSQNSGLAGVAEGDFQWRTRILRWQGLRLGASAARARDDLVGRELFPQAPFAVDGFNAHDGFKGQPVASRSGQRVEICEEHH